jgi:hypothetical protein
MLQNKGMDDQGLAQAIYGLETTAVLTPEQAERLALLKKEQKRRQDLWNARMGR